jgi:hypothetical protein
LPLPELLAREVVVRLKLEQVGAAHIVLTMDAPTTTDTSKVTDQSSLLDSIINTVVDFFYPSPDTTITTPKQQRQPPLIQSLLVKIYSSFNY